MKLLEKVTLGSHTLKNRMAMAPMTRSRANVEGEVNDLTALYYKQRSSAGLIITEGVNISKQALGSPFTPGLFTSSQVESWKKVTDTVHENNSVIYAQLWHTGRAGHSSVKNGELPVAPSAIAIAGQKHYTPDGMQDYEVPRALSLEEIKQVIQDYKQAGINAIKAGFDGVELHAANGYLPNQFLSDNANHRTDEYGGSIENRNRFVLEIMQELIDALGENKVAIRLSPTVTYNGIFLEDPIAQFSALISELDKMPLSYIHLVNGAYDPESLPNYPKDVLEILSAKTNHVLIANGGYNRETGESVLEKETANLISYGALFLANPDLPRRFELNSNLNQADPTKFFGGNEAGYTDYPFLETV